MKSARVCWITSRIRARSSFAAVPHTSAQFLLLLQKLKAGGFGVLHRFLNLGSDLCPRGSWSQDVQRSGIISARLGSPGRRGGGCGLHLILNRSRRV